MLITKSFKHQKLKTDFSFQETNGQRLSVFEKKKTGNGAYLNNFLLALRRVRFSGIAMAGIGSHTCIST